MPDGVLQWIDPRDGQAAIARGGHVYAASSSDIEPAARHAGAHVHFDIRRQDGGERAVDIRLRPGTRPSHHRRRSGTLAGARRPDSKGAAPFARPHPERGRDLAAHPLEVARSWVDLLQDRDLDAVLSLHASDAVLHGETQDHRGRAEIGRHLEASPLFGIERDPDIIGDDGTIRIRWADGDHDRIEVRTRVEHGLIAEQWIGAPAPGARSAELTVDRGSIPVDVRTRGLVDDGDIDHTLARLGSVLRHIDDPILFARLKLELTADPARAEPAIAQFTVDVDGDLVRAHVAGRTMRKAADRLHDRLRAQLERRAQRRHHLRTRGAEHQPGAWRHGDLPGERPRYYDRPVEERQLVRHRTFTVDELTVDEAAFDMEQLDYDFHLFRDLASGHDAVIERLPRGGYRLTRLLPSPVGAASATLELTVADTTPAELSVPEAIERLDVGGEPFVFFANATTGRGNVVYRRYDGHYGLVTAA